MKPRRGRGHGAIAGGEHGLVILIIGLVYGTQALKIGWQWHGSVLAQGGVEGLALAVEGERYLAAGPFFRHRGPESVRKDDLVTGGEFFGRAGEAAPACRGGALVQGEGDFRLPPKARKLGRDDAGVVENQDIAGPEQGGQVAEDMVVQFRTHLQQA